MFFGTSHAENLLSWKIPITKRLFISPTRYLRTTVALSC